MKIAYYIIFFLLYSISLLPLRVLYLFSSAIAWVLRVVIKYRKEVILNNLQIAFPEKTLAERMLIAKKFYLNFTDNFIEVIKLISANKKFVDKHFIGEYTTLNKFTDKKLIVLMSHHFNWEMASVAASYHVFNPVLIVYFRLTGKTFDHIMKNIRTKGGATLVSTEDMRKQLLHHRYENYVMAMVADQNPSNKETAYWINFFGKRVPFVFLPEKLIKHNDAPVIFSHITKIKRGYYKIVFNCEAESSKHFAEGKITIMYARHLEKIISEQPETYLWSHRRWRHDYNKDIHKAFD